MSESCFFTAGVTATFKRQAKNHNGEGKKKSEHGECQKAQLRVTLRLARQAAFVILESFCSEMPARKTELHG